MGGGGVGLLRRGTDSRREVGAIHCGALTEVGQLGGPLTGRETGCRLLGASQKPQKGGSFTECRGLT